MQVPSLYLPAQFTSVGNDNDNFCVLVLPLSLRISIFAREQLGVSSLATARCQITDWKEGSAAKGGSGLHTQAILFGTMD